MAQLDGIAFGAGPGSFTGLRIACGVAQGLALGAGLPVIGICTLEALAQEAGAQFVIAALDARMREIYHAAYEKTAEGWQSISEPALCLPGTAPLVQGIEWTGCGSGFDLYDEALRAHYDGQLQRRFKGTTAQCAGDGRAGGAEIRSRAGYRSRRCRSTLCQKQGGAEGERAMSAQLQEMPRIRRMVPADLDAVVAIEREVFLFPWTRGNFSDSIDSGYHCLVLEQGGEIFGYGVMTIGAEEGHLLTLSIAAGSQRKGWGERLLREFIHLAKERLARTMFLDVRESNRAAARLYERLGFKQIGKRRGYYPAMGGREDSLVMELVL